MNNKIYTSILYIYQNFKISIFFWLYLLKRVMIYGIVPASCALIMTVNDFLEGEDHEEVKQAYRNYYGKFKETSLASFMFSIVFIVCWFALFFLNKMTAGIAEILVISVLFIMLLTAVFFSYFIYLMAFERVPVKKASALAFLTLVRYPKYTVALMVLVTLLMMAANWNLLLFIFFGPFLYGAGVRLLLGKASITHQ